MMSPGVEVNNRTITSSDGPVRYTFDLDVDYITERFIAMSFPSGGPEAQYRSNLRDVVNMLKTKHSNNYIIFNLSKRRNDIIKMNDQVLDVGWHDSLAPPLERLCSICKQIETWLKKDPQNVAVLHCKGSRSPIGVVVLAYMNYISITANSDSALDRYAMKRFMEAKTDHHMQPSQFRYEGYFTGLLTGAISINSSPLYLHHIAIHGVPNYDANGGCKPFIRIYQGMQNVYTSGVYTVPEGTTRFVVSLDKALPLRGDILVKCYHKKFRSSTRDVVFRCQFHTTAVVEYRLLFGKEDLDDSCTDARFPPFTKVELIFSSTGDRLHNSDYISQSNFAVDNTEDPLIRWDSYENFSKLIEGSDFEGDTPEPNSGENNNLPPGSTKYIYAPDGSPYAQVQKGLPYGRSEEPILQSQPPQQMQQAPPPLMQKNGPTRQNAYTNGPTGGTPAQNGPTRGPPGTNPAVRGVERTPSGRQMDFKEQRDLEELLKGIEDPSDLQGGGMKTNGPVPGSPQKSQMVESPGNRRIVSVHAELKTAPAATKRTIQPVRPIREEEFENLSTPTKEESGLPGVTSPPITRTGPVEEQMIAPERIQAAESAPPYGNVRAAPLGQGTRPIPNGNAGKECVPLEHANPTYDYTQHGRTTPNRTGGMIEEPITEVRLKAGPVSVQSLESSPPRSEHQTAPSNSSLKGGYEPQPLQAQQQKIKFITKYDDEDPNHHDQTSPSRPQQTPRDSEDSQLWLKRQQGKMRGPEERDGSHHDPYQPGRHSYQQERYPVHESGMQSTHRGNVHQAPSRSYTPTNPPTYPSGPHSPSSSIKSEPVTTGGRYVPDNLSWLEQQQMKLREKKHRERLGMDPSHPLQVDTSYSVGQVPSQPSSVSSIRSDVSGFSNTPYTQQRLTDTAAGMATRRGYHPEPINVAQHPPRRGPPTPAQGYDNMATTPRQAVQSPDRALEHGPSNPNQQGDQTPQRSQSLNQHRPRGTGLHIDEPVARPSQAAQQQAQINTNNSANVYSPNIYAPDTSLPTMRHAPVSRNDSLGGYESDTAIHCVPSKLRPGEAEQWLQNPGGLPSRENVHWNRVEGLHLPEERSPRDMHSSNESIPNGGTTPKFPVGPKGYANMVKTCIAVVGKPPHGPDEPLPLSPIGGRREDVLETTLPRQPEPARRQLQSRPMEEQPQPQLNVRPLQPITRPDQERPLHVRQLESAPDHRLSRGQAGPARSQPVDVESLEALLETVSPVEARGGVPNRPTGPGPYDGGRGASPPLRKGVLYTDIEIDPDRGTVKQTGKRLRYETGPMAPMQNLEESRVYPTAAKEAPAMPHQARPLHQTPVRQPVDQMKPSLVEEALASPSRPTNQSQPRSPVEQDIWFKPSVSDQTQTAPPHQQRRGPNGYPSSQSYTQVPIVQSPAPQPMVEEPISKTELSPAKVVIQDLPLHVPQQRSPPQASQGPGDSQQQPAYGRQQQQPIQVTSGNPVWSEPPGRTPGAAQHGIPQYVPQPQRAIVDRHPQRSQQYSPQNVPSQERVQPNPGQYTSLHESMGKPVPQPATPQQVPYQSVSSSPYQPTSYHQTPVSQPQAPSTRRVHIQETRQEVTRTVPSQHWQGDPGQQPMEHEPVVQQRQPDAHQPPQQYHQHHMMHQPQQPMTQRPMAPQPMAHEPMVQQRQPSVQHTLPQQQQVPGYYPGSSQPVSPSYNPGPQQRPPVPQSPGSEPPSISFSEATPPPKHINELQSPIFGQKDVGGEQSNESPQGIDALGGPGPSYPTYSHRSKGRPPQPLYPTFSDRHRRGHLKMDEASAGQNGNYKTLYDNRNRGRMSSESDASAVSPGTTSPIRQAVSPAGPSPSPSGRSTPSNFYLMPFTSPYGSSSSLADPNKEHVRFVKDLSSWWYKPHITREEAIGLLRDKQPGTFVVRDSNSFPGAFGLAIKVSQPPANTQPRKAGDPSSELIRHFLIEPNTRGVRLKGCINEPVFGSLSALIYQHTLTQLALPCKLVLPEIDPAGVDSPDAIDPKSAAALLQQGAACNVLYMEMIDMESLTGPSAVREGISRVMNMKEKPKGVKVHLKVSLKGVTVTDKARKLFFRKHYPVESILYCGMDPGTRKIARMEGQDTPDAKCFGIICRKPGSLTDNQCLVFAEYEVEQPASAIVSFVTKVLLGSKQAKTP